MGRPKGSKNKPKTPCPVSVVEMPPEPESEPEPEPVAEPGPADLARFDIDGAIRSRSLERVSEVLTDVERVLGELETELGDVKADLGRRIKVVRARRADLIHEIETLTHDWVCDHAAGVAYLVHRDRIDELTSAIDTGDQAAILALAKTTRPLGQDDLQEGLPFAAEG